MRIIVSAFVFVFIFFNLSGCSTFCTTSCDYRTKLPKNQAALESERVQILEGTIASSQKGEVTTQIEGDGGQAQALDAGLTVGIILGQINVLLDDLATSARDLTQEMRAIVGDVEGSTSQLISEIDDTLGNRLDDTLDQLNESERRLMTDAQSTIFALERSIQAIREGSDESIKTSLWEASIVAWDAEHSLPCIERVPRLVYATPSSFRIWPDYSKPGDPSYSDPEDRRKLIVKLRGNFLNFAPPLVAVDGNSATVRDFNHNEIIVELPESVVERARESKFAQPVSLEVTVGQCKEKKASLNLSTSITVKPPLRYSVAVRQEPTAKLPRFSTGVQNWYDRPEDCNAKRSYTNQHTIGPPSVVRNYKVDVYSRNGNSYIQSSRALKYKVEVKAKINGKGKDCFLGVCNCKGRGWLGYSVRIDYADYFPEKLRVSERTSNEQQESYSFPYTYNIPTDHQDLKCFFYARVAVDDAGKTRIVELDYEKRIVEGIEATVNTKTCDVTITVPPSLKVLNANSDYMQR